MDFKLSEIDTELLEVSEKVVKVSLDKFLLVPDVEYSIKSLVHFFSMLSYE